MEVLRPAFADATVIAPPHVGWSIAVLFALNGCAVALPAAEPEARAAANEALSDWQRRADARGQLSDVDRHRLGTLLHTRGQDDPERSAPSTQLVVAELRDAAGIDAIVDLEHRCPPQTVLGVATLLLPLGPLTERFTHPGRVIGMHFMHPAHARKAIEVIPTAATSESVRERVVAFCERDLQLNTVVCRDVAGFVVNRVHLAYLSAAAAVAADYPDRIQQLDELIREALGLRMGPYRLMDELGLPNVVRSLETMSEQYGPAYQVPAALTALIDQGRLGRRSGRGFLDYQGAP